MLTLRKARFTVLVLFCLMAFRSCFLADAVTSSPRLPLPPAPFLFLSGSTSGSKSNFLAQFRTNLTALFLCLLSCILSGRTARAISWMASEPSGESAVIFVGLADTRRLYSPTTIPRSDRSWPDPLCALTFFTGDGE